VIVGIAALSRRIYSSRLPAIAFLIASILAPALLLFLAPGTVQKWVAIVSLAASLVNVSVVAAVLQTGKVPALKLPQGMRKRMKQPAFLRRKSSPAGQGAVSVPVIAGPEHPATNREAS